MLVSFCYLVVRIEKVDTRNMQTVSHPPANPRVLPRGARQTTPSGMRTSAAHHRNTEEFKRIGDSDRAVAGIESWDGYAAIRS